MLWLQCGSASAAHITRAQGATDLTVEKLLPIAQVTASNLILVDMEGETIKGRGNAEATAFWIHSRLHNLRPNTGAVFHTHQPEISSLACLEGFK